MMRDRLCVGQRLPRSGTVEASQSNGLKLPASSSQAFGLLVSQHPQKVAFTEAVEMEKSEILPHLRGVVKRLIDGSKTSERQTGWVFAQQDEQVGLLGQYVADIDFAS